MPRIKSQLRPEPLRLIEEPSAEQRLIDQQVFDCLTLYGQKRAALMAEKLLDQADPNWRQQLGEH